MRRTPRGSNNKVVLSTWMHLDGHSFRSYACPVFSRPAQSTYHHVPGDFHPTGTFIMRVAKRKVLAVSSNILPWPKAGLCSTEARMRRNPWFSLLLSATSVHLYAETTALRCCLWPNVCHHGCLAITSQRVLANWKLASRHIRLSQHLSYRNLIKKDAKPNQRGQPNTQIERVR